MISKNIKLENIKEEKQKVILEKILLDTDIKSSLENGKNEIFKIIPELKDEDGFDQKNPWHIFDVWNHTVKALENSKPDCGIRITLLLHDIGKPHSYQDDGEIRHFKGHSEKSAQISEKVLKRLGFSEKQIQEICYLIKNHSTIIDVENVNENNLEITKKLIHIQYCDALAYNPKYTDTVFKRLDEISKKIKEKEKNMKNIIQEDEGR